MFLVGRPFSCIPLLFLSLLLSVIIFLSVSVGVYIVLKLCLKFKDPLKNDIPQLDHKPLNNPNHRTKIIIPNHKPTK